MLTGAGASPALHPEYEPQITRVYQQCSDAVEHLPGLLQRILNGIASWVLADPHAQLSPLRVVSEMSSISSRGPSSLSENDNRVRNSRTSGNMVSSNQPAFESPPPSPAGSERGSKACCFCWCCCCSCSCLTVKNGEDNKQPRQTPKCVNEKEEPPSFEEIKLWAESFDRLMQCNAGRKLFREFLRSEYSEENMLFWLACEDLKTTDNPEMVEEKARLIYEDYISLLSPKEVSLDSRVRELINKSMVQPTTSTFEEAQLQIYTLMHRDSYPRFLNSSLYKNLLHQLQQKQQPQQPH